MSVNTVRDSKNRLKQLGLIGFQAPPKGSRAIDGQTKFWFTSDERPPRTPAHAEPLLDTVATSTVSTIDTVYPTVSNSDTVLDTVRRTVSNPDTVKPPTVSNSDRVSDTVPDPVPDTVSDTVPATNYKEDKEKIRKERGGGASPPKHPTNRFLPPTLEEVTAYFLQKEHTTASADRFFNHFTANGWKVSGRTPMKNWPAAANNWIANDRDWRGETPEVTPPAPAGPKRPNFKQPER